MTIESTFHQKSAETFNHIAVIIGTFGDREWHTRGIDLVTELMETQTTQPGTIYTVHATTLAEARNFGAVNVHADYLIFLDADDKLDKHYVEAMQSRVPARYQNAPRNIIYRPAIRGFRGSEWLDEEPLMFQRFPLLHRNYLPIGSMVTRNAFVHTMFEEWPCLEDWALWLNLVTTLDATVEDVPEAVYLINDEHNRNQHPDIDRVANEIRNKYRWGYFQSQEHQDGLTHHPVRVE